MNKTISALIWAFLGVLFLPIGIYSLWMASDSSQEVERIISAPVAKVGNLINGNIYRLEGNLDFSENPKGPKNALQISSSDGTWRTPEGKIGDHRIVFRRISRLNLPKTDIGEGVKAKLIDEPVTVFAFYHHGYFSDGHLQPLNLIKMSDFEKWKSIWRKNGEVKAKFFFYSGAAEIILGLFLIGVWFFKSRVRGN